MRAPLFLAVAGLWLLLAGLEFCRPCFFLHDDNAAWFIGAYAHDYRVLTETGRIAEVNFFQYGGEPFLEQGQTAVLYPPVYAGVALAQGLSGDVRWTIEWLAALHLTLGLVGFACWLRAGGVEARLAVLGGLAWVLNPFVLIVASSWIMVTYAAAWLPWLFWAMDRLLARPSRLNACALGGIAALFCLQGYVQWVVYALLFLGAYALFGFFTRATRRLAAGYGLVFAAVVFLAMTLPLLIPMAHAAAMSVARAQPIEVGHALFFRVTRHDLLDAELGWFQPHYIFGMSSVLLYSPALLFLPVAAARFFIAEAEARRRLFPLLLLGLAAIFLSSRWHVLLTMLPVTDEFRWPFKMFLLADFFLIAAFIWTVASWPRKSVAILCTAVMLGAQLAVALGCHDTNFFSATVLPTAQNPLPAQVDAARGRVIAIGEAVPPAEAYRFLMGGDATLVEVPSLGGYNPLVSPDRLWFALGLDFPNLYRGEITPAIRAELQARAVRYWIVDPRSSLLARMSLQPGLRAITGDAGRVVLEDTQAAPLAYAASSPTVALPLKYAGNSILVSLGNAASPALVSVGPTDGWWCRIDGGAWHHAPYENDRLKLDFPSGSREAEISYFDPRLRTGLGWAAWMVALLGLLFLGGRYLDKWESKV